MSCAIEAIPSPCIYALIAPRPLQCQNGDQEPPDAFTPALARTAMDQIRPAYAVFGATDKVELHIHPGAHEIDLDPLVAFMDAHLR